jgi:nucleoside-diphosphate-sugar epimerase
MRVVVTGGSGKAGKHVLPYLAAQGHEILNLDLIPFPPSESAATSQFPTLKTDLTDSGQVFNALTSAFDFGDFSRSKLEPVQAVIHLAAFARVLLVPDNETFSANVRSTYNVIEAACKLGIKKVVIASSETVYGACFAQGDRAEFASFPLTEDMDVNPEDSYAISKICGERVARGFSRRFPGTDIYVLRIGNVVEPHEYARDFPVYLDDPATRFRNAWSYIDARDLGQICDLCLQKSGLGYQIFNATNDTITTRETTKQVLDRYAPDTPRTRELGEREAPLSNKKIRDVLGFKDVHDWKKYLDPSVLKS